MKQMKDCQSTLQREGAHSPTTVNLPAMVR